MKVAHASGGSDGRLADLVTRVRDVIRRKWLTLLVVAVAVFAIGVVLVLLMTPKYTSIASVRIDPTRNPLATSQSEADATLTPEAIETEVSVISSLDVARKVVVRQRLENDPEFAAGLTEHAVGGTLSPADRQSAVAAALQKSLAVGRDKLTYILNVRFTSRDPIKSARIANAFAEAYIETKTGSKSGTAASQSAWFHQRLAALGAEVEQADARVAQYRAQTGIVATGAGASAQGTIADQQVGPLSSQLATAQSEAAAANATYVAAQSQISGGGLDAVSAVLSSPVIAELRRQRAEILRTTGDIQAQYGDKHPESIRVHDQLASIDSQIKDESQRVVGSLRADATAAEARSASLRGSMHQLDAERANNTRNAVMADGLEREAAAKLAAYQKISQLSVDSSQAAQNSIAQVEIVDRAQPPSRPTSPNKPVLMALALLVGLGAGAGTISIQEMMVTGLRSTEDVEEQLGVPLLAAIPMVPKNKNPANLLLEKPTSMFSEALRIARASILGVRTGMDAHVIAFTSALPSEGKTTTSLAFARTLAINNSKTLLIDCDVRRASLRPLVGHAPEGPGIVEVLQGEATAEQAIHPGDVPGLDHLLVRAPYFSSGDLFGAGGMEKLLAELRKKYELIVLDLPPLVGLADGRFLAVLADATALCVKWDATPVAAVTAAMSWLKSDNANAVGVIFTMVDSSAEAIGGLYYSKKYSAYYQAA